MSTNTETVRKILAEFANLQNEKKLSKATTVCRSAMLSALFIRLFSV